MPLFQKSVVNKYLKTLDNIAVEESYHKFIKFYGDKKRLGNIKLLKEENYQEGFLREIFVQVLGYTSKSKMQGKDATHLISTICK